MTAVDEPIPFRMTTLHELCGEMAEAMSRHPAGSLRRMTGRDLAGVAEQLGARCAPSFVSIPNGVHALRTAGADWPDVDQAVYALDAELVTEQQRLRLVELLYTLAGHLADVMP